MLGTILIILLIVAVFGTLPAWPHSRNFGYFTSGIGGILLIIVIILLLTGRI